MTDFLTTESPMEDSSMIEKIVAELEGFDLPTEIHDQMENTHSERENSSNDLKTRADPLPVFDGTVQVVEKMENLSISKTAAPKNVQIHKCKHCGATYGASPALRKHVIRHMKKIVSIFHVYVEEKY